MIRVYDVAGNVIETHEQRGRFTLALVIVGAVGLLPQAISIGFTFWLHFHR